MQVEALNQSADMPANNRNKIINKNKIINNKQLLSSVLHLTPFFPAPSTGRSG
jgi:hypothetical protein